MDQVNVVHCQDGSHYVKKKRKQILALLLENEHQKSHPD